MQTLRFSLVSQKPVLLSLPEMIPQPKILANQNAATANVESSLPMTTERIPIQPPQLEKQEDEEDEKQTAAANPVPNLVQPNQSVFSDLEDLMGAYRMRTRRSSNLNPQR